MTDDLPGSAPADVPQAVAEPKGRAKLPLIWVVPLVAVLVGGWLAVKTILQAGPTVTISFRTAEGLEAGKTKIKLKDVDIGVVKEITLAPDRTRVVVTAELSAAARGFLVEDTRFWVVRPRISGGGVSGLGTLLSGAYIGVDAGKSSTERRSFVGLEVPPILTGDLPGRQFQLHAKNLGSIGFSTPVYYRRFQVGEVTSYSLDGDGQGVSFTLFVHAPYDRFVTNSSKFWQASGIDISLDASGVKIESESIASILMGGIAFGTPPNLEPDSQPDSPASEPAPAGSVFELADNHMEAFAPKEVRIEHFVLLFNESARGLQVGAPVDFRGIAVGEVADIGVDLDPDNKEVYISVEVRYFPDRMRLRLRRGRLTESFEQMKQRLNALVAAGFRGQLRTGNLLTGQLYVALDFFPNAPEATVDWNVYPPHLPTMAGGLQGLQTALTGIATKLDKLPYDQLVRDVRTTMGSLDATLKETEKLIRRLNAEVVPSVNSTLEEARGTLGKADRTLSENSPLQRDVTQALREVSRAAASVRVLADYLERHPESLIRGKPAEETRK